ncbi:MAG: hypothetical protein C4305_05600 [Thermoleophilia bacterium]
MRPHATLIVNPAARSLSEERLRRVERLLASRFFLVTVLSERRGHAVELAREAEGEAIFVLGGDGTFNEAVNGADGRRPLGFLPAGGANVLPRALGLPNDAVACARRLLAGRARRISVGRVNGRRFLFSASLGPDAEAVRRVEAKRGGPRGARPGNVVVALTVVRVLLEQRLRFQPALELKEKGRAALLFVCNAPVYTYAGPVPLRFCPQAQLTLGLDYAAPVSPGPLAVVRLLARAATGRGLQGAPGVLWGHDLDRLEVVCDHPFPLQVDGEDMGDVETALFEAERDAVAVLA